MTKDNENLPDHINTTAHKWNKIAKSWHSWIPRMREWYAPATKLMIEWAQLENHFRVLDIAAGDCDQSIEIARIVGPNGYVLAIDVADDLLKLGLKAAREAGYINIEVRIMDGGNLDLPDNSFDAVVCRFALMYLSDPLRSLEGINRVLRPNGQISIVVYGSNGSPEFSLAVSEVRKHLELEEEKAVAHSLGEVEALQTILEKSCFENIQIRSLDIPIRMVSSEECVRYLQATSPTLNDLISKSSTTEKKEIWDQVNRSLKIFEGENGFELEHKVIVAAGSKKIVRE
jgi:ubiquinone/menaquinone biosynthesis C-methylase UbiE